ncbi:IBR domain containing protein [Trichuris trichiura]|uniref:RBR-type E3 ubiquitin transferase n=1 Tax=Trichuris trichiura TaxID=36087 RepID=A0A077Z2R2_TRITR|nr:IBR domain containing protein [Trichuris trichiura]
MTDKKLGPTRNSQKSCTLEEETYDNFQADEIVATLWSDEMCKTNDCKSTKDGFEVLQSIDVHNIMLQEVAHASRVTLLPESVVRFMLERCRWDVNHFLSSYYENGTIDALCRKWNMRNPMAKSDVQLESDLCGICYASKSVQSSSSLYGPQCGHYFCRQCWQQYAAEKMGTSVGGLVLTCPAYGCNWPLDDRFIVGQLTNEEQRQRYVNLVTRTFVKVNSTLKPCPQTNCSYLLRRREGCFQKAVCKCGYEFCFDCCQEWHEPLECHLLKQWIAKCEAESDSAHWIADHTRPCPRCNTNIEKSGGCNHMRCTQPFCQFEFCWTCQGAWDEHADEYYVCRKGLEGRMVKPVKEEGQRFFSNVFAHSFKPGSTMRRFYEFSLQYKKQMLDANRIKRMNQTIERNITALRIAQNVRWIDTVTLEDSVETLKRCMRTVKYTIVFIYYLRPNVWVRLAKGHEDRLDENCKRLLDLLEYGSRERKGESLLLWRQSVVNERARCLKFERTLLDFCRDGYNKNRWKFMPDNVASRKRA